MTKINSEAKYQEILEEQKEIKSRLERIESLLDQLTSKKLFEGRNFLKKVSQKLK